MFYNLLKTRRSGNSEEFLRRLYPVSDSEFPFDIMCLQLSFGIGQKILLEMAKNAADRPAPCPFPTMFLKAFCPNDPEIVVQRINL